MFLPKQWKHTQQSNRVYFQNYHTWFNCWVSFFGQPQPEISTSTSSKTKHVLNRPCWTIFPCTHLCDASLTVGFFRISSGFKWCSGIGPQMSSGLSDISIEEKILVSSRIMSWSILQNCRKRNQTYWSLRNTTCAGNLGLVFSLSECKNIALRLSSHASQTFLILSSLLLIVFLKLDPKLVTKSHRISVTIFKDICCGNEFTGRLKRFKATFYSSSQVIILMNESFLKMI